MLTILKIYDLKNTEFKKIQEDNFSKTKEFLEKIIVDYYEEQVINIIKKINKRFGKTIKFLRFEEDNTTYYLKLEDYFIEKKEFFIDFLKKNILDEPTSIKELSILDFPMLIGVVKKEMLTKIELGLAFEFSSEHIVIIDQEKKINKKISNELLRFLV
jgi:hypothetical protein